MLDDFEYLICNGLTETTEEDQQCYEELMSSAMPFVAHAKTKFTVRVVYDDAEFPDIYRIDVFGCFLTTPGSTSGTQNNAAPTMTVTLQPRGGGRLADAMEITKAPRG